MGGFGDDGGGSGSGAAAPAGGDEHHLGVGGQKGFDVVRAFQGGAFPDFGVGAGAQTFGEALAQLNFGLYRAVFQGLRIRVAHHKIDAVDAGQFHVVNRVASAAANANDLDHRRAVFG